MSKRIPQMAIDEVLAGTDLVQLIDGYLPLKRQGVNFVACCPFHHEKSPSFNVIPKKQFYYCFGCGASGNAISFLMAHQQLGFIDAVDVLAQRLGLTLPREATLTPAPKKSKDAYKLLQEVGQYYKQCLTTEGQVATDYMQSRGLTREVIETFELGYAPDDWHRLEAVFKHHVQDLVMTGMLIQKDDGKIFDRYRARLMFPIHDRQGRIVGFGGRALAAQQEPKYMNSPETPLFHKSRELYGLHQVLQHKGYTGPILVVEGYMDVIALAQYGLFFTVATLGTATTTHHLQLLSKHTKEVVFCFDGDDAGKKAAERALEHGFPMMDGSIELKFMFLPDPEDPDSYIRKAGVDAFLTLMQEAKPFSDFWMESLQTSHPVKTLSGRSQLIREAVLGLNQMPESTYKLLLIDQVARVSRTARDEIRQWMRGSADPLQKDGGIHIARSPLRLAIALLLQYPERMTEKLGDVVFEAEEAGAEVLKALIDYLKRVPSATTAMLLEQWRETTWFEPLQKLGAWPHQVPEARIDEEFLELIQYLGQQNVEKEIEAYMQKSRTEGLDTSEQIRLQALIKRRHQL